MKNKVVSCFLIVVILLGIISVSTFAEQGTGDVGYIINAALNKEVTISSSADISDFMPGNMTDGYAESYFEPSAAFEAVIDLGEPTKIEELKLYSTDANLTIADYVELYLSVDGVSFENKINWETGVTDNNLYSLYDNPHGSIGFSLTDDETEYRYIKVVASDGWKKICEIEALSRKSAKEVIPNDKNVALNKSAKRVEGSTGTDQSAKLTDGSDAIGEFWQGDVVIDFGGYYPVDKIAALSRVDEYYGPINYTLTLSDISTFTGDNTVVVKSSDQSCVKGLSVYDNPSKNELFRYVKFSLTDVYAVMNEIMVFTEFGKNEIPVDRNIAAKTENYTKINNIDQFSGVAKLFDGNDQGIAELNTGAVIVDLGGYYKLDSVATASRLDGYYNPSQGYSIKASDVPSVADAAVGTVTFKDSSENDNFGISIFDNPSPDKYYRYVKLELSSYAVINELFVFAATQNAYNADGNIALGKPVFVNGGFNKMQTAALTDGSGAYLEYYQNGFINSATTNYAQVDLGAEYDIGRVILGFRNFDGNSTERKDWTIQLSSDKEFTNPKTYSLTEQVDLGNDWVIDIPESINCRYIRLHRDVDTYALVSEIAAYTKTNAKTGCVDGLIVNKNYPMENEGATENEIIEGVMVNPGYNLKNKQLIVVSYDQSGILGYRRVILDDSINTTFSNDTQSVCFNWALPCDVDENGNVTGKIAAFIWDGFLNIKPVTDIFEVPVGTHIVD